MFESDNHDSCSLHNYLNSDQRKVFKANNNDQIIDIPGQGIVRQSDEFGNIFFFLRSFDI